MNRPLGLLGICKKAGKLIFGERQTEAALKTKTAKLVLVATDASERTRLKIIRLAETADIPCVADFATMEEMGHAVGSSASAVLGIGDAGFADAIGKMCFGNTEIKGDAHGR